MIFFSFKYGHIEANDLFRCSLYCTLQVLASYKLYKHLKLTVDLSMANVNVIFFSVPGMC